jgi:Cell wall-associated hydrolases (invasion-associated proteins)
VKFIAYLVLIIMGIAAAAGAKIEKNVPAELTAPGIHAPAEIGEEQVPETETEETVPETPEITPEEPEIIPEIPAATVDHYISVSSIVNVRSGPGTSYSSLGKTDIGDMFSYRGETGNWYKTTYMRKDAYISKSFASVYEIKKGSDKVEAVIDFAETLLGYPYVYGAERYLSASGKINSSFKADVFDCSSFTQYAYYMGAGIKLGLTTRDQVLQGTEVKKPISKGAISYSSRTPPEKIIPASRGWVTSQFTSATITYSTPLRIMRLLKKYRLRGGGILLRREGLFNIAPEIFI